MSIHHRNSFAGAKRATLALLMGALAGAPLAALAAKGAALDPQQAGIAVYPGAKADAQTTEFVRTQLESAGAAYRSTDGLGKVVAFYAQQAGVKALGDATRESALFGAGCKEEYNAVLKKKMSTGCSHQITVQNPWMDMKSGKMVADTLITIVKQP